MDTSLYEQGLTDDSVPVKVLCRVRPLSQADELSDSDETPEPIIFYDNQTSISIADRVYTYDHVFPPDSDQFTVYNIAARPIVEDILQGYNGTIFAYGQTSSGKTHTIEGSLDYERNKGILPRVIDDVFEHIDLAPDTKEFVIKVSYFEIYMERIRDLLDPKRINLPIHEDCNKVPYVKGVSEVFVTCTDDLMTALHRGHTNRSIATTNMNEHSSRSHCVFLLQLRQTDTVTQASLNGKLYVVDLAGSEKVSKTKAVGTTLSEAKNINKSLSALGNVISALSDGLQKTHIPYRDSKLTRILQQSLGGNSRTSIIICCSPSKYNLCETKSTLFFGQRAKSIHNAVHVNKELPAEEWRRLYEKERAKRMALQETQSSGYRSPEIKPTNELDPCPYCNRASLSIREELLNRISSITVINNQKNQAGGNPSPCEECERYREKCDSLYAELDDKDEEIHKKSQLILELEATLSQHDQASLSLRLDFDTLYSEYKTLHGQHQKTKGSVTEIETALVELVSQYQELGKECEEHEKETKRLNHLLETTQEILAQKESELSEMKANYNHCRKNNLEMVLNLFNDLEEVDTFLAQSPISADPPPAESNYSGHGSLRYKRSATFHGLPNKFKSTSNLTLSVEEPKNSVELSHSPAALARVHSFTNLTESITGSGYSGGSNFHGKVSQLRNKLCSVLQSNSTHFVLPPQSANTSIRLLRGKPKTGRSFGALQRASRGRARILPPPLRGGTPTSN